LKVDDRSKFRVKKEDIIALLDALQELFQEHKDEVTPKEVAARMGQKLHKQVPLHLVANAYTSLGFITRKSNKSGEGYYLIPNPILLAERRFEFCKNTISSSNQQPKH
jgi:hypothetical protein